MFVVLFNSAIWSSVFSLGKWVLEVTTPLFLTASRMLLASLLIFSGIAIFKRKLLKVSKKQLISLGILGLLSVYLSNVFEYFALARLSAGKTCFLYSLSPFVSAILSYFHFKEKLTPRKIMGLLLGFAAFTPMFMQGDSLFTITIADFAMFGAVLASVWGWILLRVMVKDDGLPTITVNGYSMLFGGVLALVHSMLTDSWSPIPVGDMTIFMPGLFGLTIISNIICYNLYGWLLKRYTATFLSFAGLTTPFFASTIAWFTLGEPIDWMIFGCTAVVMIALWIVYLEELRLGYFTTKRSSAQLKSSS